MAKIKERFNSYHPLLNKVLIWKERIAIMKNPVQHQVEAFNNRDIDAFLKAFATDVRAENGRGEEMMSGREEFRAFYENLFGDSPSLHCEIINRTKVGNWIIDEEKLQGLNADGLPEEAHAVVAYTVNDGEITFVRIFS